MIEEAGSSASIPRSLAGRDAIANTAVRRSVRHSSLAGRSAACCCPDQGAQSGRGDVVAGGDLVPIAVADRIANEQAGGGELVEKVRRLWFRPRYVVLALAECRERPGGPGASV